MDALLAAIGWPHVAFLFGLIFVLMFRTQIGSLLGRVTSIDKSGIKTQSAPELQLEDHKRAEVAHELMQAISSSVAMSDIEGRIRAELTTKSLPVDNETSRVLLKYLAAATLSVQFEQIHSLIFGSQIFLLKKLNEVAGRGRPRADLEKHFEHVKGIFPDSFSDWDLAQYIDFLVGRSLIIENGGVFHITNLGNDYLVWITRSNKPENRALMPNPSLKRRANGRPPGPVWRYAVHFHQPGPGVLPSSPA